MALSEDGYFVGEYNKPLSKTRQTH